MKKTWKAAKIHNFELLYGTSYREYKEYMEANPYCDDDRKVYIAIYDQIMEALESLPEQPNSYVRVAMYHEINRDRERMNAIESRFLKD